MRRVWGERTAVKKVRRKKNGIPLLLDLLCSSLFTMKNYLLKDAGDAPIPRLCSCYPGASAQGWWLQQWLPLTKPLDRHDNPPNLRGNQEKIGYGCCHRPTTGCQRTGNKNIIKNIRTNTMCQKGPWTCSSVNSSRLIMWRFFVENKVWEFQTTREADPSHTFSSRMLLSKWAKNFDGTPGALAPLVVTGYGDIDALEGRVQTDARNTSRFSKSLLLSVSVLCNWNGWTADVSTAFLQGLPHERQLWIKLPADALAILGASSECMLLMKSLCGQFFDFANIAWIRVSPCCVKVTFLINLQPLLIWWLVLIDFVAWFASM